MLANAPNLTSAIAMVKLRLADWTEHPLAVAVPLLVAFILLGWLRARLDANAVRHGMNSAGVKSEVCS